MIPLRATRYIFGVTIMLAHFVTIAIYFFLGSPKMEMSEVIQGIGTVAPVAAIYVTTFITYVANHPVLAPDENKSVSNGAFGVQYIVILIFCAALVGLPIYVFTTSLLPHEQASIYTGGIDTVFAGYLGIIFKKLFPFSEK